ncbi:hypothetical protein EG835_07840, partial [bacterium]|nr:hypothetical protein [bacterium]
AGHAARAGRTRELHDRLRGVAGEEPDAKGALQEWSQASARALPAYRIVTASGPPHRRWFSCEVSVGGELLGTGEGPTKQAAEKAAAASALAAVRGRQDLGEADDGGAK